MQPAVTTVTSRKPTAYLASIAPTTYLTSISPTDAASSVTAESSTSPTFAIVASPPTSACPDVTGIFFFVDINADRVPVRAAELALGTYSAIDAARRVTNNICGQQVPQRVTPLRIATAYVTVG